jgi:3-phenylpropionate/trans-cinnamate dioxygenase ferredoxin subunit
MPAERLFPAVELPDGTMRLAWPGGVAILVVNRGGKLLAVDGVCTHEYCELDRGFLSPATGPLPRSRFDLESGEPLDPPAEIPLGVHVVSVDEQGWVVLQT